MTPEQIDRYIASIPGQECAFRRRVLRMCQRCGADVGSDSLATCLWPVRFTGSFVTDSGRFGFGRVRLCQRCAEVTRAVIRVPARTWSLAPKPRRQKGRGRGIGRPMEPGATPPPRRQPHPAR